MKNTTKTKIFLGAIGVSFIAIGLYQGGYNDILQKAIRICLECIGIG